MQANDMLAIVMTGLVASGGTFLVMWLTLGRKVLTRGEHKDMCKLTTFMADAMTKEDHDKLVSQEKETLQAKFDSLDQKVESTKEFLGERIDNRTEALSDKIDLVTRLIRNGSNNKPGSPSE